MEHIDKIAFIVVNFAFLIAFLINFVIGLVRDIKAKKKFKSNDYLTVNGKVVNIQKDKKLIHVFIEFTGPNNLVLFSQMYDFTYTEFDKNPYTVGQEVKLAYTDVKNLKKVHTFPVIIEGTKPTLEKGPLFANLALVGVAAYFSIYILISCLNNWDKNLTDIFNSAYILVVIVIYFFLLSYLSESLFSIPRNENQNYLKMFGHTTKARVITFKLAGTKNNRGFKESRMTIEYRNHLGELTKTNLNSYMYTETQEEYIDIVYDPKNAKNVVYLKK